MLKQDLIFGLDLFHGIVLSKSSSVSTDKMLAAADHRTEMMLMVGKTIQCSQLMKELDLYRKLF